MTAVAIYARYSTEEQDPRSIEDQVRRCTEHATKRGYRVVAEFADAAVSGSHTDRVELQKMRDIATAARRSPFRAVLVDDLSRLSRSIGDTWRIIDDLAGAGIEVIDVRTGMSSNDPNARVMFAASSMVNDQFLQLVRYQTHRGLTGRALGGFSTGGSLYGYATIAEPTASNPARPRKVWVVDEVQATVVRRIFREYDEGAASYKAIAEGLNNDGVPAPRDVRRGHKHGRGWGHTTILAMLNNAKYVGVWVWNQTKWVSVPGKRKRRRLERPESEHVTPGAPGLAIVDQATWDRVQARLMRVHQKDKSGTRRGRPPGSGARSYLVSGLLRCGVCGGPMSIASQKTKAGVRYANFGCTAHRSRGVSICANNTTISETKISTALVEALRDTLASPEVQEIFATAFRKRVEARSKPGKAPDFERELRAAEQRVQNATRLIIEMPDDLELRRHREVDKAEVRRLLAAMAAHKAPTAQVIPQPNAIKAALAGFLDVLATAAPERGREALARTMSPLTVTPDGEKPGHLSVTGSLNLASCLANCSSGGRI